MSYQRINPIPQFNFQANRVLTYGKLACREQEIEEEIPKIRTFDDWDTVWLSLAKKAESENRYLHAAYYGRMAEFFLTPNHPQKDILYRRCLRNFYLGFDSELHLNYKRYRVPFENGALNCISIPSPHPKGTILVCGGYDSFIEEFVLQVRDIAAQGYSVILFEGPGQGYCLREKMYFRYDFEKPTAAVIDYFGLKQCAMIGISWGGYFALRSATFEKRISAAVAYDVMDDGLEVMTNVFPAPICKIIRTAFRNKNKHLIQLLTGIIRKRSILADWALSQGMYITGTKTVYDFYCNLSQHNLSGIENRLTQDILLLAGENDHYIPLDQYYRLKSSIKNARSLTCRLFTKAEGGDQHCQIGNHMLAVRTILDWLNKVYHVR
ncbi:Alpha/beta hydrolase [Ruminococcaceae bacterium BL-6]|nr:Alpha/beta hydrolase [Ruminococcaceae bacterium BL-6]